MKDVTELVETKHLTIRGPDDHGAWLIRLPLWPWTRKFALEERKSLIANLIHIYPFQALWFYDWDDESNHPIWALHSPTNPLESIDCKHEGGWALFFFNRALGPVPPDVSALPTEPPELKELLTKLSAQAAIVSWYDDHEWLLVKQQ